jgi:hypothetical protein
MEFSEAECGTWLPCAKCGNVAQLPGKLRAKNAFAGPAKPHRAGAVLTLAIIGWLFVPAAVCAVVMGAADVKEMENGEMDASGKTTTDTATTVATIAIILWFLGIAVWLFAL